MVGLVLVGLVQVFLFVSQDHGSHNVHSVYNFMLFDAYRVSVSLILFGTAMITLFFATMSDSKNEMLNYISEVSDDEEFPLETLSAYFNKPRKRDTLQHSLHDSFQLQVEHLVKLVTYQK